MDNILLTFWVKDYVDVWLNVICHFTYTCFFFWVKLPFDWIDGAQKIFFPTVDELQAVKAQNQQRMNKWNFFPTN